MWEECDKLLGFRKKVLHAGRGEAPDWQDGSKATFHFKTRRLDVEDQDKGIIDDSKKIGCPMVLLFGKKFKMPIWEQCLKTMRVGEVALFNVDKSLVDTYPIVSKGYRQYAGVAKPDDRHCSSHRCGMMAMKEGTGHSDLDQLMQKSTDLEFVIELLQLEAPGDYDKESWAMEPEEKLASVPKLREEGNVLYRAKEYKKAAEKYTEALNRLEQLLLREKPGDEEWNQLDNMKIPLLLNYSQCKLLEKDYYAVIEHTTSVLQKEPNNIKALFRRAKAHVGAWNPVEAREDFCRIMELDPSLENIVRRELQLLGKEKKKKNLEDKEMLKGKIFNM
ncbi:AH receptor-interacting protein isoform X1 [Tachypleus tridentatus]|uniref:AH receptor-interacting protein isoform X1 n=2 Tax=Tachypleus tridentatus TaxID=6853 RepID=UPI003FD3D64B